MRTGITGHQKLEDESAWAWVHEKLVSCLVSLKTPLIGVTSLAIGADQLFANVILKCGGNLEIILPFPNYADTFNTEARKEFERLLEQSNQVDILPKVSSEEMAYLRAGEEIVERVDLLFAIWDGRPAAGLGGTADIVKYARAKHVPGIHINPETLTVTSLGNYN